MYDLTHFQVERWLDSIRYHYATEGKNISRNRDWIGISCPFCPVPDHSTHLGINTYSKAIRCWRCGTKGTIIKLVMKLEKVSYENAEGIISRFSRRGIITKPAQSSPHVTEITYPLGTKDELLKHHVDYLISRNFDPDYLVQKYQIKSIGPISEPRLLANRIFIPFFLNHRFVTYTARDMTDIEDRLRYWSCPADLAEINIDHTMYNIDTVKDVAVVVEGCTDVWRMGDGFVGMSGLVWNSARTILLKRCKQVFVWPDTEHKAISLWKELAYSISSFVPDVRFIEITEGDPGALDPETARNFRREIFGRSY